MKSYQYQEPERYPEPSHRGAAWLNGIAWAIVTVCFLLGGLPGFLFLLLAAGLGAVANLAMCVRLYATGRGIQAVVYLLGFLPLALLAWWLWNALGHIGKIGG